MEWLIKGVPSDAGSLWTLVLDRGPAAMNDVLDRVARYKKLAEEDELIRSVGYSWPHPVRVYNHLTLWQLLNSAELNLITVPRGLDLDAEEFRPRRHLPTLVTMLVQHQNGCPDPEVSFMVGGSTHVGATLRLRTHPISVALIEAAAAGIITVDADYPNSDE